MRVLRRDITGRDISTMEFSWELGRGPIGVTTTDGAAIDSAVRAVATITRIPATIRGIHRKGDTHHITGHRAMAGNLPIMADTRRIMVVSHQIMAGENHRTTVVGRRIMVVAVVVANPRAAEAVANLPVVVEAGGKPPSGGGGKY